MLVSYKGKAAAIRGETTQCPDWMMKTKASGTKGHRDGALELRAEELGRNGLCMGSAHIHSQTLETGGAIRAKH